MKAAEIYLFGSLSNERREIVTIPFDMLLEPLCR